MTVPVHAGEACEHQLEHTEQHDAEDSKNQCCPPFSICQHCSLFVYVNLQANFIFLFFENYIGITIPYKLQSYTSPDHPIWQPPQSI
jgi:hypothetical protein